MGFLDAPINPPAAAALALKAPLASPTFTGTVTGVTKAMVGLANVDNTADVDKPVSTATAASIAGNTTAIAGKVGKGDLWLSVVDYASVQAAVTAANTAGRALFWPDGSWTVNSSITNFHAVKHVGNGVLIRSGNTYRIAPTGTSTNNIYVDPTGSDANDGLSAIAPLATIQAALDLLPGKGFLDGAWTVKLAAGTYAPALFPDGLVSRNFITVQGPIVNHPNVPTAIIDVGGVNNGYGLSVQSGTKVIVSNIRITNGTGTLSIGLNAGNDCDIYTDNVHTDNIYSGIQVTNNSRLRAKGGKTSCTIGIAVGVSTVFTIGYANGGSTAGGVQFNGCYQGIKITEGSTGHADYNIIDGCTIGIEVSQNSRVNDVSNDIKNCTTAGIRGTMSCYANAGNTFTNNATNFINDAFGLHLPIATGAQSTLRVGHLTTAVTLTGSTTKTIMATPFTIPAGYFTDPSKEIQVIIRGTFTTATGSCTIGVDFGTTVMSGLGSSGSVTGAVFEANITIHPTAYNAQKVWERLVQALAVVRHSKATRAVDMTVAVAVNVVGTLTDAAGSIVIETVDVNLIG